MKKNWIYILICIIFIIAIDLFVVLFRLFESNMIQKRLKVVDKFSYLPFKEMLNDSVIIIDEYSAFYKDTILEYNCLTKDSASIMIIGLGRTSFDFSITNFIVKDSLSKQKNIKDKDLKYFLTPLPPSDFITYKPYFTAHNVNNFDNNAVVSQVNMVHTSQIKENSRGEHYRIFEIVDTCSHIRFYKNYSDSILLDIHYVTTISSSPFKTYVLFYEHVDKLYLVVFATKKNNDEFEYRQLLST